MVGRNGVPTDWYGLWHARPLCRPEGAAAARRWSTSATAGCSWSTPTSAARRTGPATAAPAAPAWAPACSGRRSCATILPNPFLMRCCCACLRPSAGFQAACCARTNLTLMCWVTQPCRLRHLQAALHSQVWMVSRAHKRLGQATVGCVFRVPGPCAFPRHHQCTRRVKYCTRTHIAR